MSAGKSMASKGAVPEGFFFAQQTPCGADTRKILRARAVAMPQGCTHPGDDPERTTAQEAAWRKTRKNLVRSCQYVGISRWVLGNKWGTAGAITFRRFATRAIGRRARCDGRMPCDEEIGRHSATEYMATRRDCCGGWPTPAADQSLQAGRARSSRSQRCYIAIMMVGVATTRSD